MPTSSPLTRSLIVASLLISGIAAAEQRRLELGPPGASRPTYVWTPGAAVPPGTQNVTSRLVFLHRCPEISGCSVRSGGTEDSRTDTSTIADGIKQLGEFSHGTQVWNETVQCVKETFAPFNITITDVDPGSTTPHFEAMFGGKGSDISADIGDNTLGIAPFNCGEVPNAIVYIFNQTGPNALEQCAVAAQEIAHAFGLEHEFLQKDPMTYLSGDLPKRFRDELAPCGELAVNQPTCRCGANMQNSYRDIVAMFGVGAPTPPDVLFKRLTEGKQVQPGFTAVIDAQDDVRVEKVDLYIDGVMVGTSSTPIANDFEIETPADLAQGEHTLEARATDVQGIVGTTTLAVVMGPPCTPDKGCTGKDVCVEGICIPGPEEPGGLGAICQKDTECLSHQCADAGEAQKHCVESCSLNNADSCPSSFECIAAGAEGVCWLNSGGGCCDTNRRGSAQGPLLLGLGVMVLALRRRRRRCCE
jgi:hypothetical protein